MGYQDYTVKLNFSNNLITGTEGKWNQGGYFDGSSAYLQIPDHADWDIVGSNSDDWTIDLWIKFTAYVDTQWIISQREGVNYYWRLIYEEVAGFRFQVSSVTQVINISGGNITDTDWHHITIIKVADEYGLYKDGTQIAYRQYSSVHTFAGNLYIGKIGETIGSQAYFKGYMDEIRIQHSNHFSASPNSGKTDTITVPTVAYTSDSNTKLLLHFDGFPATDSGNTGHVVTNNNVVSELGHSYDLPLVFHLSDPQEGMKATVIKGTRGDGSIVIPGGKRSQEIRVRGKLFNADGYKDLTTLMNEMRTNITTDIATLTLRHLEGTNWIIDWSYTVRRIEEINFPSSMRIGMQEYEISFLVVAY